MGVVESIPGLTYWGDVTDILAFGHWASYNVPFWPIIAERSHVPQMVAKHGVTFSHDLAPRARIFRRDAGKVNSFDEYKALMRSNNYLTDPISNGNPLWAVCSRGDLSKGNSSSAFGCYDGKYSKFGWLKNLEA